MSITKKILIVDDKKENLYLLRVIIANKGYQVIEAINGKEALEQAHKTLPDLIISDILMPVMDGFALCREWRSEPQLLNIPFIFYTATYTESKDRDFALSLGADLFLVKPQEPSVLMQSIEEMLSKGNSKQPTINKNTNDDSFYRQYNVRLVHKLEDKLTQIEKNNSQLVAKEKALHEANKKLQQAYNSLKKETQKNSHIYAELNNSKKTIQQHEHELESIINNLIEAVFLLSDDLIIIHCNLAATKIFGHSQKKLIGLNLKTLIPNISPTENNAPKNTQDMETLYHDIKLQGLCCNNKTFPIRISLTRLSAPDEKKLVCSCLDITQQEQQEEQLRRTQKMDALGQLTSGIAHDFNNMLGVIMGYSDLLKITLDNNSKEVKYVDEIHHAGERAKNLVKKLLGFSKQNSLEPENININKLILNQQNMLEKSLTVRIKLELSLAANLWSTWLDPSCLEDAILNMSINSMHAIPSNGKLKISTQNIILSIDNAKSANLTPGEFIVLTIADNGTGMDEETRQKIFDPFFSTKGEQGTGLGMSQVYGFVQQSKGAIKIQSQLGEGTTISIYIPRCKKTLEVKNKAQLNNKMQVNGTEKILVVDDEKGLRELTREILIRHDFNVLTAESAEQALELLHKEKIDLLISDLIMPQTNGYELAKLAKQQFADIKILIISGFDNKNRLDDDSIKTKYPHLKKPYNQKDLLNKVRMTLNNS